MSTTTDNSKQFSVGTQWKIKNLTSETGKKFNGKTCVIVSTFDVSTGRLGVRIKNARDKGRTLNIKPINLHDDPSTTIMEGCNTPTFTIGMFYTNSTLFLISFFFHFYLPNHQSYKNVVLFHSTIRFVF